MSLSRILLADLHLDSDPLTEYRWDIFEDIKRLISKYPYTLYVDILGDITEKKDKHDSLLVNRILYHLNDIIENSNVKIRILMGNHDYISEDDPFFEFLNQIENVYFISQPVKSGDTYFLPHSKNLSMPKDLDNVDFLYLHQPFKGSVAQGGFILQEGADPRIFDGLTCSIYSGDIHSPQRVGKITYVGSPYHVYFGDNYDGRALVINGSEVISEPLLFPKRYYLTIKNLEELDKLDFNKGDQVKFKIELNKDKLYLWDVWKTVIKDFCIDKQVTLVSTELKPIKNLTDSIELEQKEENTKDVIDRFACNEKLTDEFIERAYEVVDETEKAKDKRV